MTQENHPLRLFIIKKKTYQIAAKEQLKDKEAEEGKHCVVVASVREDFCVHSPPLFF